MVAGPIYCDMVYGSNFKAHVVPKEDRALTEITNAGQGFGFCFPAPGRLRLSLATPTQPCVSSVPQ